MSPAGISNQNFLESNLQPIRFPSPAPKREKVSFDMLSRNLDRIERAVDFIVGGGSVENFEVYEKAFANLQRFAEKSSYKPLQDRIENLEGRLSLASQFHAQDVMNAQIPARVLDWAKDTAVLSGAKLREGALIAADWSGRFAGASGRVIVKAAPIVADSLAKGATRVFQGTQAAAAVFGDIASQAMSAIPAVVKEWTWTKTALSLVGISGAKAFYNDPSRVAEKCTNAVTKIFTLVDSLTDWIGSLFGQASSVLEADGMPTFEEVGQFFEEKISDPVKQFREEIVEDVQDKLQSVADDVKRVITESPHFDSAKKVVSQALVPAEVAVNVVEGSTGTAVGALKLWNAIPLGNPAKVVGSVLTYSMWPQIKEGLSTLIPSLFYQSVDKAKQATSLKQLSDQLVFALNGVPFADLQAGKLPAGCSNLVKEMGETLGTTEKLKKWASFAFVAGATLAMQLATIAAGRVDLSALGADLPA